MAGAGMSHYLWEMRPYFRQVAGQLVLGSLAGIVMNTAVVLPAILLGRAIDSALAFERGQGSLATVGWAALAYVGGVMLTEGPRALKRWWLMTANGRIRANVRADALRGVLGWPMERLHTVPIGDVMARIVGDVETLGVGVREVTIEMWDTVLFSISLIVAMLVYDPGLTALALLPVPLAMTLSHATGRWVASRTMAARAANADLTACLQEQMAALRLLRLSGRTGMAAERFGALSWRQALANVAVARLRGGLQPVYTGMMMAGVALLVWQGGGRVVAGTLTVGAFVAYLELFLRFVNRGFRVPQLGNSVQSGGAAYERLRPLLARPLPVQGEPPRASFRAGHVAGSARGALDDGCRAASGGGPVGVSLRNVTFRYPGAPALALRDISLDVAAGTLVGVAGPVGSGKSALARAMLGVYPLEGGEIRIGDRPLEAEAPPDAPPRAGYLPQDGQLFSGTVRQNVLLFAPPGDGFAGSADAEEALRQAVGLAALEQDLRGFPAGLETEIGDLGGRVSGGQRQRIGLARAVALGGQGRPGLLVLDDPFSAVDVETEATIIAALREAFGPAAPPEQRATIILCSHRLAAFTGADSVVVLDGGQIVECGTHAALLDAGSLYARCYRAQAIVAGAAKPAPLETH